jgi:hypothetical protein
MFRVYPIEASEPVARALANLTTYDGSLPQGAPTSPILSNLICRQLDSRLFQWARDNGYAYTRYADDLTFSTNRNSFPEGDRSFVKEIVEEEGFSVHPDKERLMPRYGRQMVTGLVVNEKVNVPREFVDGLRALLHNVEEHGWKSQVARQQWLFDDGEEWERYRDREMSAREFREYDQEQREKHLLVRPNAVMSKVQSLVQRSRRASGKKKSKYFSRAVKAFKQAVEGKINYIGQIKGRRNDKFRKLRDWYDYLKEFDDEVAKNYREIKGKVFTAISHQEKERLSRFQSLHRQSRRGTLDDVSQTVEELQNEVIELQWISRTMEVDKYHNQIAKVARCAVASPVLTGTFFQYVNTRDGYFKELIHRSSDEDPHTTKDLLKRCRSILTVYDNLLPPTVIEVFNEFLGTCERVNRTAADWHPYEDQEFLKSTVRPFKREIRFEDGGDGADLAGAIEERVEEIQEQRNRAGQSPVRYANPLTYNLRFNTYTPQVKDAVQLIVESTITNSNVEETELEVMLNPVSSANLDVQLDAVCLTILDKGGFLRSPNRPSQLFGGKLRKATRFLRGLAGWRLSYPTKEGDGFQSYVLSSDEYRSLPTAPDGVRHDLTFYF